MTTTNELITNAGVITTARSVAVGLAAWLLAFVVAYAGRINPVHLNAWDLFLLVLSALVGFFTVTALGKIYCRHGNERANAVMVFATCWFVGIYAPITAIWANAPFNAWMRGQTIKPKPDSYRPLLVVALEKTAVSYYLGLLVVLCLARFLANHQRSVRKPILPTSRVNRWMLSKEDIALGMIGFLGSIALLAGTHSLFARPEQWVGYTGTSFLLCFLVRSFRLEYIDTKRRLQETAAQTLGETRTKLGLLILVAGWAPLSLWLKAVDSMHENRFWTLTVLVMTLWIFFSLATKKQADMVAEREELLGRFALRIGLWGGIGFNLIVMVFVFPGIANRELGIALNTPTPFALTVIAMEPVWAAMFLTGIGFFGPLLLPLLLRREVRASELIAGSVQGGIVAATASSLLLVFFALSVSECTVVNLPANRTVLTASQNLMERFTRGEWIPLARTYMAFFLAFCAVTGLAWAIGTAIHCAFFWLWKRLGGEKLDDLLRGYFQRKIHRSC